MLRIFGPLAESYKKRVMEGARSESDESDDDGVTNANVNVNVNANADANVKVNANASGVVIENNNKGNRKKKRSEEKGKMVVVVTTKANKKGAKSSKTIVDRDGMEEVARRYQKQMKMMPIPKARLGEGEAANWVSLYKTMKGMYGQPFHYLTFMLCQSWDQIRCGSEDDSKNLDSIIDWKIAETTIWNVEQFHRLCCSPAYLAMLWSRDPLYRAFVDEVIPPP